MADEDWYDEHSEIGITEAQHIRKSYQVGDRVVTPLKTKDFGRIAAQTAKHVIRQGIREAERSQQLSEIQSRAHDIVQATVTRVDPEKGIVALDLGKGGEAILPRNEQVPGEVYTEGQMLQVYIVDVVASERGPRRANVYRKNLLAAWNWAVDSGFPGFPQAHCPLERIRPFPVEAGVRYVPPEEDVIKVLQQAHGQDLVMLLTYYYTGARRGEVFRLLWSDVNFDSGSIRLVDHKGRDGSSRARWVPMHPELAKALRWWQAVRPCVVDNVFMQEHCDGMLGEPFQQRSKLMPRLCRKAGVKPFGFHALRHKAAAITFTAGGLAVAQTLMGHSRATTTDIYVRSAGLYGDRSVMMDALGESSIGIAAEQLLEMEMPRRPEPREAFCKHGSVNNRLQ